MTPLAETIRPKSLEEWVGHPEVMSPGKPLYEAIKNDRLFSFVLYAPPGSGKTTLCQLIKSTSQNRFKQISAVTSGVKDLRAVIDEAKAWQQRANKNTVLFIDEIHRFNKSQQDALLSAVERGEIILIGATTENPSFELNAALLSRLQVIRMESLRPEDLDVILRRAVVELEKLGAEVDEAVLPAVVAQSQGDARFAINALENLFPNINLQNLQRLLQKSALYYDKTGDQHYQVISAFIKSMRASQTDAALYYLARMWEAGEDVRFIARRMVIFASEDIGNADIKALAIANAVRQAVDFVGRPECYYALAQGVLYLSAAKKSREVGDRFSQALDKVRRSGAAKVPEFLVNAPTKLDKELGRGRKRDEDESFLPSEVENLTQQ